MSKFIEVTRRSGATSDSDLLMINIDSIRSFERIDVSGNSYTKINYNNEYSTIVGETYEEVKRLLGINNIKQFKE